MAAEPGLRAADPLTDLARAKVNLFLHVRGRRPDGRHTLESLAVFPQIGDVLTAERSPIRSLSLDGPFAMELGGGEDNLVMRATEALAAATGIGAGVSLRLDKRLPVASGIGGGSADAGAALRLLMRLWGRAPDAATLGRLALDLGADVPVCLASAPAMMRGAGEALSPAPLMPGFWLVLANPLRQLSTGAVFGALERRDNPPGPAAPARFASLGDLVAWLARQRNDLEAPARDRLPAVASVLGALRWAPDCLLARMSGSGATCFGVFATQAQATAAAARIRDAEPGWWTAPAPVAAWEGAADDGVGRADDLPADGGVPGAAR
ncbi:4-(cytidine 5'-diphospho)-2-C-methyl-D-erythritol kinase [Rubrimonas cliftonensis]|uniref:4-diphosphocytidyl-2-C-methyl-D-erythritol kinase n=1 Tax=Rubrimonas cliftonensis TaxID=89524 RepID=A0A1H3VG13_9RHOB|nr:4-diphosphocytidyl-2-C-methyl-D-erythritol kinase [Rubrimonas cliftonensis]